MASPADFLRIDPDTGDIGSFAWSEGSFRPWNAADMWANFISTHEPQEEACEFDTQR